MSLDTVHISFRRVTELKRLVRKCFTCKKRTRHVGEFEDWSGWTIRCCACGDSWQQTMDGWWLTPRPFERGWRKRAVAKAQELWRKAGETKAAEAEARP